MKQEMAAAIDSPQDVQGEELLLLQEIAASNLSSSFLNEPAGTTNPFSHFHPSSNHPPSASCDSTHSFSSGSHKRPISENPTTHNEPNPKKPNTTHPLFGFSKIPMSPQTLLRRCSSDPYCPPLPPVVEEPPLSPQQNAELESPGTPLSKAIGSNKLPPRPPTLKRSVSDLIPSPAKAFSNSSDSPHAEWLKKMRDCTREMSRKWNELLGDEEAPANKEINYNDNNCNGVNNEINNNATMENYDEGYVEAVSVEKKGEALILHFKCPCGSGYQVVLLGGNCYYKLI